MQDKSNFYILGIIAIVAVVAIVVMAMNAGHTTNSQMIQTNPVDNSGAAIKVVAQTAPINSVQSSIPPALQERIQIEQSRPALPKLAIDPTASTKVGPIGSSKWVYAEYWDGNMNMPYTDIDVTPDLHLNIIYFGSSSTGDLIDFAYSSNETTPIITYVHNHGGKVQALFDCFEENPLYCNSAISPANRARLVANIVNFTQANNYDGIEIYTAPWTGPLNIADFNAFTAQLKAAFNNLPNKPSLSLIGVSYFYFGKNLIDSTYLDKIDIGSGNLDFENMITWHASPLYSYLNDQYGNVLPSVDSLVNGFITQGVPPEKLLVSMPFYGDIWTGGEGVQGSGGVTGPGQVYTVAPQRSWMNYMYADIARAYNLTETGINPPAYRWDNKGKAAYLSFDNPGSANDQFITYQDPTALAAKVQYVGQRNLGGVAIYPLNGGYRSNLPPGQRTLLYQSVRKAIDQYWIMPMGK